MQVPLEISARHTQLTPELEAELQTRVTKLERRYARLTSCRIAVEAPGNHRAHAPTWRVRLDITLPGHEVIADKEGPTVSVAIGAAFDAAERQVAELNGKRREEVRTGEGPATGKILQLFDEEGCGYLLTADGRELYFHRSALEGEGFAALSVGAPVHYTEKLAFEGPLASMVAPVAA